MNIIDYLYIALVASMVVMTILPGGLLQSIINGLVFFCLCSIVAKLFDIMKDK